MKLIASNQMTLTNLLEKAETRRETFYKLTNEGALGNLVVESKLSKGWLNGNGNGQILGPDAKGERTTDFIQVVAGKTYTFQWWATVSEGQKCWEAWQFYDSNQKPFGSRGGYGEHGSDGEQHGKRTITAPTNACYIRLSFRSFGNGHMMFEAGAGSASFEPSFDDSLKQGGRNLLVQTNRGATNWEWAMGNGDKHVEDCMSDGVNAVKLVKGTETECTSWSFFSYKGLLRNLIRPSAKYTLSFDINPSKDVTLNASIMKGNAQAVMTDYLNMPKALANQWTSLKTVLTAKDTLPEISDQVVYLRNFSTANGNYAIIKNIKLEESEDKTPWTPAPEDLGWSMATLVPTQQQRYLWKFEYIYYSDGSVEVTQPTNISIAGVNGQTSHVHFAFADNATGGGFSLTTPKAYMGWYADFNETASNDPTKYKWGKWKGDQGAPGGRGDDGKTSYLHLAFASSANGKTGFSFTDTKQQYQGYYTDFTQSSSTDPTKYVWVDRLANVKVGGVNLLHNSKGPFQPKGSKIDNYVTYSNAWISMEKGKEYTLSAKGTAPFTGNHTTDKEKNEICLWLVKHDENINVDRIISSSSTGNGGTKFTWNDPSGKYYLRVNTYKIDNSNYAEDVQIEEGNVKTTYTRNPEDVQSDIDSKADQALTQQQLNALAEQNSIVKAEMEAKASIDTVNQWITAYQNYVNANDEAKAESERNLQEASARILQLKTDVGTLRQQWDFIDTYMTVQNEGLIIGKSDGSAYAKFANDRISLFSGSSEVMYISQGVLRIENGIFTKTIQIGRFRFETHPADADMLVLRYLGG